MIQHLHNHARDERSAQTQTQAVRVLGMKRKEHPVLHRQERKHQLLSYDMISEHRSVDCLCFEHCNIHIKQMMCVVHQPITSGITSVDVTHLAVRS